MEVELSSIRLGIDSPEVAVYRIWTQSSPVKSLLILLQLFGAYLFMIIRARALATLPSSDVSQCRSLAEGSSQWLA